MKYRRAYQQTTTPRTPLRMRFAKTGTHRLPVEMLWHCRRRLSQAGSAQAQGRGLARVVEAIVTHHLSVRGRYMQQQTLNEILQR
jgi:GTP cyclohydrolase III